MPGRVVVVTGGSAGLGRGIATAFARGGDCVGVLARDEAGLEATVAELRELGVRAEGVPTDVAVWEQVGRAAAEIEGALGPIDVWVNNAMASVFEPFKTVDMDDFHRATGVTYLGFVHGTRAALDRMLPRDRGVIVQVGSALAMRSIPLQSAYCGSKHAMVGFTESLRTELLHDKSGVVVTMVHMPAMNTPQFDWVRSALPRRPRPVAPIYQPEVAAKAVCHAADHPQRRAYYVGSSTVLTVWVNKFVPGLLDRYLARSGFKAQQDEQLDDPYRDDNLFGAVRGDHAAHGRFDADSHARSLQVDVSLARSSIAAAVSNAAKAGATAARSTVGAIRRTGR